MPLPLPTSFGGKESYIDQLTVQLNSSDPRILFFPEEIAEMATAAATIQGCQSESYELFKDVPAPKCELAEVDPEDICYLQYSSGSTRFPTGVAVTHRALLHNLYATDKYAGHKGDRCISWLPWYHDMGLVGVSYP